MYCKCLQKIDNQVCRYWENACQIIPPHDKSIASTIEKHLEPWGWSYNLVDTSDLCSEPSGIVDSYFEELSALSQFRQVRHFYCHWITEWFTKAFLDLTMKRLISNLFTLQCMVLEPPLPSVPLNASACLPSSQSISKSIQIQTLVLSLFLTLRKAKAPWYVFILIGSW